MDNPNPVVQNASLPRLPADELSRPGPVDARLVFEAVRDIQDPEYPNTLEELSVVSPEHIYVSDTAAPAPGGAHVRVDFTPTVPHCSMATVIGLCVRVRAEAFLRARCGPGGPAFAHVDVFVREGRHVSEDTINKQLNDKERVAAALENEHLVSILETCLGERPAVH